MTTHNHHSRTFRTYICLLLTNDCSLCQETGVDQIYRDFHVWVPVFEIFGHVGNPTQSTESTNILKGNLCNHSFGILKNKIISPQTCAQICLLWFGVHQRAHNHLSDCSLLPFWCLFSENKFNRLEFGSLQQIILDYKILVEKPK